MSPDGGGATEQLDGRFWPFSDGRDTHFLADQLTVLWTGAASQISVARFTLDSCRLSNGLLAGGFRPNAGTRRKRPAL